ncbi:MAG: hypothetical protein BMS9Abin22_076 [Gammaproteobacteria bacterium]|nr:MAG: hypothetical protein BMS9Abin22_076 [Gammaproteobacteria bacterium]
MQRNMKSDIDNATNFLFEETYHMWRSDLQKIFRIGTKSTKGGCNFSSCMLVMIGIESFSKYFSSKESNKGAFSDFFDNYYPDQYHGKMKKIYELFRHGLAHYYYPKCEYKLKNITIISFWLDRNMKVISLSHIKRDLDYYRTRGIKLNPSDRKPYVIVPQVLFLDTVNVMEKLKKTVKIDSSLRNQFIKNYLKIKKDLRHIV